MPPPAPLQPPRPKKKYPPPRMISRRIRPRPRNKPNNNKINWIIPPPPPPPDDPNPPPCPSPLLSWGSWGSSTILIGIRKCFDYPCRARLGGIIPLNVPKFSKTDRPARLRRSMTAPRWLGGGS